LVNGVKVDIVNYPYKWLGDVILEDNIRLASRKDIAAMKIAAITQRGSRKDFIDLYFLLQIYSLQEIFAFYEAKITDCNTWLALRSLSYFEDAEQQPMPKMYVDVRWEIVKRTIKKAIANF
jgi:predicted nucleotidyltransferase component of viral defense system